MDIIFIIFGSLYEAIWDDDGTDDRYWESCKVTIKKAIWNSIWNCKYSYYKYGNYFTLIWSNYYFKTCYLG